MHAPHMDILCEAKFEFEKVLRASFPCASRPLAHPERFIMPRIATITSFHLKNNHNGSLFSLLKAETIRIRSTESWMSKSGSAKVLPLEVECIS